MSFAPIGMRLASAVLVVVLVLWSTRAVNPLWPAVVFALGRSAISFATGGSSFTVVGTAIAALLLGAAYFWGLQHTQGRVWWWVILVIGLLLFSI